MEHGMQTGAGRGIQGLNVQKFWFFQTLIGPPNFGSFFAVPENEEYRHHRGGGPPPTHATDVPLSIVLLLLG